MKEFFEELNKIKKPGKREIIEKDYHLHRLLYEISRDDYLSKKLAFKGGTCLIKAHMSYYRFSEDIDFTWKDTSIWDDRTPSETRKLCSEEIDVLIDRLNPIISKLNLEFKGDKSDEKEIHISSGGRMVLFFIGYQSELLNRPERIKVEINFVDKTLYPLEKKVLQSYIEGIVSEKIEFLYKDQWKEYTKKIQLDCYTPKEIFVEKCRAAMTRRTYKLRDIIDIYFIEENYGITVEDCREKIIEKTNFMLDLYGRYRENIRNKIFPRPDRYNEEMDLMIIEIPKDLIPSIKRIHEDLKEVKDSII